ncbi:MAG: PRC-barrel domain-containing protein [Hadesarchaea archaeon]|nr:PRC-barrel domain-containing protein [Hadesarchaea archaeon]
MRVSEYYGMRIYSDRARYVGSVQDVVLDDEDGEIFGLALERRGDKVATVPYSSVMAIGDIILVRTKSRSGEETEEETES